MESRRVATAKNLVSVAEQSVHVADALIDNIASGDPISELQLERLLIVENCRCGTADQ